MTIRELYEQIDADYEDAIEQFEEDEYLEEFVKKFPEDPTYGLFMQAVSNGNIEESFVTVHTLKGVVSNFSFTCLVKICELLTEQLRPKEKEADLFLVEQLKAEYEKTVEMISKELV